MLLKGIIVHDQHVSGCMLTLIHEVFRGVDETQVCDHSNESY